MGADDARDRLVAAARAVGGDALRDVWLFDEESHEALYVRDDVRDHVERVDVDAFLDNERYGYVTRRTFESLHYTGYDYTVRSFDAFVQFRTFLGDDDPVGLLVSYDPGDHDFDALHERVAGVDGVGARPAGD